MKKLVCEVCGGNELKKQGDEFVCQYCGTKYSIEDARKLIIELDSSKQINNLLILARHEKSENNYHDAYIHYSKAQELDPGNWEAVFFSAYCKAMNSTIAELKAATHSMEKHMPTIAEVLYEMDDLKERQNAIKTIVTEIRIMSEFFRIVSRTEYYKSSATDATISKEQYIGVVMETASLNACCGAYIGPLDEKSGNTHIGLFIALYKQAVEALVEVSPLTKNDLQETITKIGDYIKVYEPSYQIPVV